MLHMRALTSPPPNLQTLFWMLLAQRPAHLCQQDVGRQKGRCSPPSQQVGLCVANKHAGIRRGWSSHLRVRAIPGYFPYVRSFLWLSPSMLSVCDRHHNSQA